MGMLNSLNSLFTKVLTYHWSRICHRQTLLYFPQSTRTSHHFPRSFQRATRRCPIIPTTWTGTFLPSDHRGFLCSRPSQSLRHLFSFTQSFPIWPLQMSSHQRFLSPVFTYTLLRKATTPSFLHTVNSLRKNLYTKWSFRRRRAWYYSSSDERRFSFIRKSEEREYLLPCSYLWKFITRALSMFCLLSWWPLIPYRSPRWRWRQRHSVTVEGRSLSRY